MSEPKDLKPCPFCGVVPKINRYELKNFYKPGAWEMKCKCTTWEYTAKEWNSAYCWAELAKKEAEIEVLNKQIAKQMTGTCLTFVCKCGSQHSISPVPMYEARLKAQEAELERLRKALEEIAYRQPGERYEDRQ